MNKEMKKEIIGALAWAGIMLVLAFGASFAHKLGTIDRDTVIRVVTGPIGLWMVWYGNRIPKNVVPNARAGQAQRVAAWSMVLSGLVYTGLFAFAPIRVATLGGSGAIAAGIAVTLGYCLSLRAKAKAV
jgi:hypothetical protein